MFAVVKVGGRQYRVSPGDDFLVEKLNAPAGAALQLPVLLWSDESGVKVGQPVVEGMTMPAVVVGDVKGEKIDVFRYQPKKRYRRKTGHRQTYTRIRIVGNQSHDSVPTEVVTAAAEPAAQLAQNEE
ncbi:MAG: 50S ribosomal protein L21 [Thermoflexales bacterium]|nr:50S ribosomal protein L21 [Thermoflexales bacterium]